MSDTVVVLVNGEVLADNKGATIPDQRRSTHQLAEALFPLLASKLHVAVMHGNKPQVGFVLFRSELASHVLHPIPLDVCGADTQGATGYLLSQAFINILSRNDVNRLVMPVITQTVVDSSDYGKGHKLVAVGPYYDRDKANTYQETRGWAMLEEPGCGYRRAVPSLPAVEILGLEGIRGMMNSGAVVIAAGGGGIPVIRDPQGELTGIEAVIETESIASLLASSLNARMLLMIVESDRKFLLSRLRIEKAAHLSVEELSRLLENGRITSSSVRRKLQAAADFLNAGGEQVLITTVRNLPQALRMQSGLRIGAEKIPDLGWENPGQPFGG